MTLALAACQSPAPSKVSGSPNRAKTPPVITQNIHNNADYLGLIIQAEQQTSGAAQNILREARKMVLFERTIIQGGCWDYLDAVWTRAGVSRNARQVVFKGHKNGQFAATHTLRAGDWLYHINYSHHNMEHSGMFIGWVDPVNNLGLTLSYAGSHRAEPARYRVYDLSGVYQITRAK